MKNPAPRSDQPFLDIHSLLLHSVRLLVILGTLSTAAAQKSLPDLAALKAAAANGDPIAQNSLGETYCGQFDFSTAVEWLRKAAQQGLPQAQCHLGQILMEGKPSMGSGRKAVPKDPGQGIQWLFKAAKQGYSPAQLSIASCYQNGTGVQSDIVEAYAWYKLVAQKSSFQETIYINPLVLRMSPQQIADGERRAAAYKQRYVATGSAEPHNEAELVLKGILQGNGKRLAVINDHTFERGEESSVRAGQKLVRVKCLEIKEKSVVLQVEGQPASKEVGLK